jgi:hypothetical protein
MYLLMEDAALIDLEILIFQSGANPPKTDLS